MGSGEGDGGVGFTFLLPFVTLPPKLTAPLLLANLLAQKPGNP